MPIRSWPRTRPAHRSCHRHLPASPEDRAEGLRALAQLDAGEPAGKIGRGLLLEGKGSGLLVRCDPHSRDAHRMAGLRRAFMTGK